METYGKLLAGDLLLFIVFGGTVAYGLVTGILPSRGGVIKRSEKPAVFYPALFMYSFVTLLTVVGAIDLLLEMNHHSGLW